MEGLECEMGGLREDVLNMRGDFDLLKECIVEMREDMKEILGRRKDKAHVRVDGSPSTPMDAQPPNIP